MSSEPVTWTTSYMTGLLRHRLGAGRVRRASSGTPGWAWLPPVCPIRAGTGWSDRSHRSLDRLADQATEQQVQAGRELVGVVVLAELVGDRVDPGELLGVAGEP